MVLQGNRPRSVGIALGIAVLALALIYVAALRHLALDTPSIDTTRVQNQLEQMRSRIGAPIDPLPVLPVVTPTMLFMARDPFAPLETQGAEPEIATP